MFKGVGRCLLATGALMVLGAGASGQPTMVNGDLSVSTYASGLQLPTAFAFMGSDDLFVTEKNTGQVHRVTGGVVSSPVLDLDVSNNSERGLLGIALDPDFGSNGHVFLYYSARTTPGDGSGSWAGNRLSRFTWDGANLTAEQEILFFGQDPAQANGPNHDGGPILFGPDGKLYGGTGDLNRNRAEQNNQSQPGTSSGVGGVYRINSDGSIPGDNPFTGDFDLWYAYGVRNTFGVKFDPVTGRLWDTENGPATYDEINIVDEGFNSGWDAIMGPDSRDSDDAPGDLVVLPGSSYSDPEFSFLDPLGITDLAFLAEFVNSAYEDLVVVGGSNNTNNGRLWALPLNGARDGFDLSGDLADLVADDATERDALLFGEGFGTATYMEVGPDGALYVLSLSNGALYRVVPEPASVALLMLGAGIMLRRVRR